jgi:putative ABC transport system permease protein
MFYIMTTIADHPALNLMPGADVLRTLMILGSIVIGIFSVILIFYTNNFLMRRRKKELGLYNILGMEKRHIAKIMFHETLFVSFVSLVVGILSGILLCRLIMLLLFKILRFHVVFTPYISQISITASLILFGIIFLLCLIANLAKIKLSNPIELLHGSNVGEKEPKTKWLLSLIGFGCIGAGYYIAITTQSPLDALMLFFLAVLLVIVGTYCLFTTGSILILKLLRKNKKFYYQTRHFTAVSGMLYRMKQNAVGLSNICILCTMVLVMVSGTVSLYIGMEDALNQRYPNDIMVRSSYDNIDALDLDALLNTVQETMDESNVEISKFDCFNSLTFTATLDGNKVVISTSDFTDATRAHEFVFMPLEDYNRITNQSVTLQKDEVLVYNTDGKLGNKIDIFDTTYQVKEELSEFPTISEYEGFLANIHYIVIPDVTDLVWLHQQQREAFNNSNIASSMQYRFNINLKGSVKEKVETYQLLKEKLNTLKEDAKTKNYSVGELYSEGKQELRDEILTMYGGFLFLGSFLGLLFIMATVLIMYYKQVSEGYEDKERFAIMQKVGMSRAEVKKSIRSQVLMVFFIPLVMAAIHVLAAFPMITKLLSVLYLTNVSLFAICTIGTVVIFAVIYAIVYMVTARTYYKIVG